MLKPILILLFCFVLLCSTCTAQTPTQRGLAWLAQNQAEDGSLGNGAYQGSVGVTSLAAMAWLAEGSTPDAGKYSRPLAAAVSYLVSCATESGMIRSREKGARAMYGHAFATTILAEVLGEWKKNDPAAQKRLREKVEKAVVLILAAQNKEGGWRYSPVPNDADISVTATQLMALRAARNAGVFIPSATIEKAIAYIKKLQNADGGFRYQATGGENESAPARTAAAIVALQNAGEYNSPEVVRAFTYLKKFTPSTEASEQQAYYYYAIYYQTIAMYQSAGKEAAARWKTWETELGKALTKKQEATGEWSSNISASYATAMSLIALQLSNNYLPIVEK